METTMIGKTEYLTYSIEGARSGGISQKDAIAQLKAAGIKVRTGAYSPFVGHYALFVEASRADDADKILFRGGY